LRASIKTVATPAAREERRKTLNDSVELAAKFFENTLASRAGAKARGYLADRGLDPATQLKFRLGYAPPERFALKEYLGKAGIVAEDMIAAGLLVASDDIPLPYDRFRDRVMFPIADLRGRVIAFGGRALEKDAQAKYLNSPETPLFHKGDNLYNHQTARKATHDGSALIVVEGYVDVIAMVTAGFPGSVAPLGTALTENQLALLWKMADEPILCFDGDRAGQKAAYRAADLALPALLPGKSLRFALLPEGQDPDDLARSGGRVAIEEVISAARPLVDMLWSREIEGGSFATPERRAALEARIGELSKGIRDEVVRLRVQAQNHHVRNEPRDAQHHAYVPGCMGFLCLGHVAHSQARACELRPELLRRRRVHVRAPRATCLSHHPQTAAIAITAIAMSRNAAASPPRCKRCLARNVVTATITERQPPASTNRSGTRSPSAWPSAGNTDRGKSIHRPVSSNWSPSYRRRNVAISQSMTAR